MPRFAPRRPTTLLAAIAVASCVACGAVAADPPSAGPADPQPAVAVTPSTSPPGPTPTDTGPPPGVITLAFGGDVHFAGRLAPLLANPVTALAPLAPHLSTADVTVVNLETAITAGGSPEPKTFHFRAPATALQALDAAGVDVVTMANNHGVDYGAIGLADTLAAIGTSPVAVVGIGADAASAFAPAVLEVRGTRVAVLGATQVPDHTAAAWAADDDSPGVASARNPARLVTAVRDARRTADVVVVYLHWGTERQGCPDAGQRKLAPLLVEAGADVVVGTHAHRVLGGGWWSGDQGQAYVDFGLGNFVWWRSNGHDAVTTGVLTLQLDGRRTTRADWSPMTIGSDGVPAPVDAADAPKALAEWEATRECARLLDAPPSS